MKKPNVRQVKPVQYSPATQKRLWIIGVTVLVLTLIAEFFVHMHDYFGFDGSQTFYAWFGFASCVVIVFLSKALGLLLKKNEGYDE